MEFKEDFWPEESMGSVDDYAVSIKVLKNIELPSFQHQFNTHGKLLGFNQTVSKQDLYIFNRQANPKMNDIISKLK